MKNKKIWIIIGAILLVLLIICFIVFNKKDNTNNGDKNDKNKTSLVEEVAKNSNKSVDDYKKFYLHKNF